MFLLKLKGEKVIGIYENISPTYQPKENEVLIDKLPPVIGYGMGCDDIWQT